MMQEGYFGLLMTWDSWATVGIEMVGSMLASEAWRDAEGRGEDALALRFNKHLANRASWIERLVSVMTAKYAVQVKLRFEGSWTALRWLLPACVDPRWAHAMRAKGCGKSRCCFRAQGQCRTKIRSQIDSPTVKAIPAFLLRRCRSLQYLW